MIFVGLQKLTLLDYPAHTACTIFTKGCNFRCPFCHNFELLDIGLPIDTISKTDILQFLSERKGKLEGVVLTGGEVLLNEINDIMTFLKEVQSMGFIIKIDTNGYFPDKLKKIIDENLVNYVAMDIKSGKKKYAYTCGIDVAKFDYNKIQQSIDILINSTIDYEFRTTLVKGIHDENDFYDIKNMIKGAKKYYLQNYRHTDYMKEMPYKSFLKEEILHFKDMVSDSVSMCELRGIDG